MTKLRIWRGQGAFDRARTAAGDGEQVCGAYLEGGEPAYFVMPLEADDREIEAQAFEIRNGRSISAVERQLQAAARVLHDRGH